MLALKYWIIFNIFISIYELYIIKIRDQIRPDKCIDNFWSNQIETNGKNFFKKGWIEYACNTDERYFNKNSYVYLLEFINVVCTALLIFLFVKKDFKTVKTILLLQLINCIFYFITLPKISFHIKSIIYLLISFIWIVIPVCLLNKSNLF